MFYNNYSPASALYAHRDELHLSTLSSEELIETLADRSVNSDYTYIIHLFNHCRNSQLGKWNGSSIFQRLTKEVFNYNASDHGQAIL